MGMMDEMMDAMMGKLSKEERLEMMSTMMEKFLAGFTVEDKQKMMEKMMPKMMEGVNMMEMMPKMMMKMMGGNGGEGGMTGMMSKMMGDNKKAGMPMMPKMMTGMMPMCLEMMLPSLPKKERVSFVPRMVSVLMDKGCEGMSEKEKKDMTAKVLGKS